MRAHFKRSPQLNIIRLYINGLLDKEKIDVPNDDIIQTAIDELKNGPLFKGVDIHQLRDIIYEQYSSFYEEEAKSLLGDIEHEPWLNENTGKAYHREKVIEWNYWEDYKEYLHEEGFSDRIIRGIDKHTNLILASMDDPLHDSKWDRRGMVVGEVQSGKTANYSGLICKAADAGYGVIVVFAGMYNDLRSQTQQRLDESFIGFDTSKSDLIKDGYGYRIGVGIFKPGRKGGVVIYHTTTEEDFSKKISRSAGTPVDCTDPIILIVKKNKSVIDNVNFWVKRNIHEHLDQIMNTSLLVIDDECDNASINTRKYDADDKEYDVTSINNGIRTLLKQFSRSAYVGYTATPYANILINRQTDHEKYGPDLFPQDFIINLPTPTNHIGPSIIFGREGDEELNIEEREGLPLIEFVRDVDILLPDFKVMKKDVQIPENLSPSLIECFLSFILSCAGRLYRGHTEVHNSFLVHVSFYVNVHQQLREYLENIREEVYNRITNAGIDDYYWKDLKKLWEKSFIKVSESMRKQKLGKVHSWEDIKPFIHEAVERLCVVMVNGNSNDSLEYVEYTKQNIYKNFIVVGGNKLSRGLTLEGLITSYFLRSSTMYDTLMQMGRWFGYRNDYLDLCRLYTTTNIVNAYRHIALATEELKQEFDQMHEMREKPRNWGLRVRSHPGVLMVTGYGKRRWGYRVRLNLGARLLQTHNIYIDPENSFANFKCVKELIDSCSFSYEENETNYLYKNINPESIISFIENYKIAGSALWKPSIVKDYIEKKVKNNQLTNWTVAILNSKQSNAFEINKEFDNDEQPERYIENLGTLRLTKRNGDLDDKIINIEKSYVSPRHEWLDYSRNQIQVIEEKYRKKMNAKMAKDERDSSNGLLLLYPLYGADKSSISAKSTYNKDDKLKTYGLDYDYPVFAPAISFSGKAVGTEEEYVIDSKSLEQLELELI